MQSLINIWAWLCPALPFYHQDVVIIIQVVEVLGGCKLGNSQSRRGTRVLAQEASHIVRGQLALVRAGSAD